MRRNPHSYLILIAALRISLLLTCPYHSVPAVPHPSVHQLSSTVLSFHRLLFVSEPYRTAPDRSMPCRSQPAFPDHSGLHRYSPVHACISQPCLCVPHPPVPSEPHLLFRSRPLQTFSFHFRRVDPNLPYLKRRSGQIQAPPVLSKPAIPHLCHPPLPVPATPLHACITIQHPCSPFACNPVLTCYSAQLPSSPELTPTFPSSPAPPFPIVPLSTHPHLLFQTSSDHLEPLFSPPVLS